MEFVRRAHPPVIKAVDDLGFLEEVKEVSPWTLTIGRINNDDQQYQGEPEQAPATQTSTVVQRLASLQAVLSGLDWATQESDTVLQDGVWHALTVTRPVQSRGVPG